MKLALIILALLFAQAITSTIDRMADERIIEAARTVGIVAHKINVSCGI